MHRGISRVEGNQNIVKKMQKRNRHNSGGESSLNSTISDKSLEGGAGSQGGLGASGGVTLGPFPDACYSVTIPDLSFYQDKGFRDYLERELVEKSTLIALQESGPFHVLFIVVSKDFSMWNSLSYLRMTLKVIRLWAFKFNEDEMKLVFNSKWSQHCRRPNIYFVFFHAIGHFLMVPYVVRFSSFLVEQIGRPCS